MLKNECKNIPTEKFKNNSKLMQQNNPKIIRYSCMEIMETRILRLNNPRKIPME